MTTKVTKESLAENIGRLEIYGDLSLNEEYQLAAYRMLLELMPDDKKHEHNWMDITHYGIKTMKQVCGSCGRERTVTGEDDQHAHMVD